MKGSYVVTWGNASIDDNGNASAFCGFVGIADTFDDAVNMARDEATTAVNDWLECLYDEEGRDPDTEVPKVYEIPDGFEVDFPSDPPSQLYVRIEER